MENCDPKPQFQLPLIDKILGIGGSEPKKCIFKVKNVDDVTLSITDVVYSVDIVDEVVLVKRAFNTSQEEAIKTFGFVINNSIEPNSIGDVITCGSFVHTPLPVNFSSGDQLWLGSTPGSFTNIEPIDPNYIVKVGVLERTDETNSVITVDISTSLMFTKSKNIGTAPLQKGDVVYLHKVENNQFLVKPASSSARFDKPFGVVNDYTGIGEFGITINRGHYDIPDLDNVFQPEDSLWVDMRPGSFTNKKPTDPYFPYYVGKVAKRNNNNITVYVNLTIDGNINLGIDINNTTNNIDSFFNNLNKDFNKQRDKEYRTYLKQKRFFDKKKKHADKCKSLQRRKNNLKKSKQRKCPCPSCHPLNKVKDKIAGKNFFTLPFSDFKIPRADHLKDKITGFDQNRRDGEKCQSCKGTKQVTDVTDDTSKYEKAAEKIEKNAAKIMEREAKLGLGGTRTTIIQGSDLLFVGLGFNNNKTYEIIPEGNVAPTMNGGKIPQQGAVPVNAVVGKQGSLAWPQQVGNYTIKCANKFNLLAGAGGITFATQGPLTFNAGITKIVGPQISIGCSKGPLSLDGETVNINGNRISITPTSGELFVKGNINNTGNTTVQGHAHFESTSFVRASCVGTTKSTYTTMANPAVLQTLKASWGTRALASALINLQSMYQNVPADSKTSSFQLSTPKTNQGIAERMTTIANLALPWELKKTGYILPSTPIVIQGIFPCNLGGIAGGVASGKVINLVDIHNIPHVHGISEMMHKHEILLPDMDYTNGSPAALRDKILNGAHESGVPADPTKDTVTRKGEVLRTVAELKASTMTEGTRNAGRKVMKKS